jgi:hypothetical protein
MKVGPRDFTWRSRLNARKAPQKQTTMCCRPHSPRTLLQIVDYHAHIRHTHGLDVDWYVQNVSTFSNTFAVVSPLICLFWIQLTRTNTIFSRIALVSCFCAEIWLSGKIPENTAKFLFYQKIHGARVRDGEGPGGHHTTWWCGPGQAASGGCVAALAIASTPPSAYIYPLTWKYQGFGVFPR